MSEKPKAVVIGAGVGGLASAASLAQTQKYDVTGYERMSFAGGRFTQHDHDGFQIPTGAVHMIPHGRKGPFAKLILGKRSNGGLGDVYKRQLRRLLLLPDGVQGRCADRRGAVRGHR